MEERRRLRRVALTARECRCLSLTAKGLTGQEIASVLGITERTVRFHLGNACEKLGARRRVEAVAIALDLGLIER